jgi:hypothetical protein
MSTPLPTASEAWIDSILDAVASDAKACGWFEGVTVHEPVSAPVQGLCCAIWVQAGPEPVGHISGLDKASGLLTLFVRVYTPLTSQPRDEIDPAVAKSVSALMRRWHDNYDFELDPLVRNVDLYGITGTKLGSRAGYVEQSGQWCRVMTITLPIIVNDIWTIGGS